MDFLKNQIQAIQSCNRRTRLGKTIRRANRVGARMLRMADKWLRSRGLMAPKAFEVRSVEYGWMVARRGSSLPMRVFTKKQDAVKEATKLAAELQAQVHVFTKTGKLQLSRT